MKKYLVAMVLLLSVTSRAQSVAGNLKEQSGQEIRLIGFDYYNTVELAKHTLDEAGGFILNYPKEYRGMAILQTDDKSSLVLVLGEPNIVLKGNHLTKTESIQFTSGGKNKIFLKYAKNQGLRDKALYALEFLHPLYQEQPLLAKQQKFLRTLEKEKVRLRGEDTDFVEGLPDNSYLRWFIPYRKLVQEMPVIVRRKTEQIPDAIAQFRNIDFEHPNFKTSGLFRELIEGHFMLLENMGQSLDSIKVQMNISSQYLIDNLKGDKVLLNEMGSQLFDYFEKRSLYKASAYLSENLLEGSQCDLTDDLVAKLEGYRKMKVGNMAPDIQLTDAIKLSDIHSRKLVVFGASWCPHCQTSTVEILNQYKAWREKNVEIVYISLDTDQKAYKSYFDKLPWKTFCDFKGWDSQAAKDYYVTGTPSYFLLDENNKILVRPNSVEHANVWITQML